MIPTKDPREKKEAAPLINERIRAPQVQLITQDGTNIGIISRREALQMAEEAHLDLVMLSEDGAEGVPIVKIMDFGKAVYERKKKRAESKKHQKVIQVKEIKIRPKISEHDFQTKMNQAAQFLNDGKRVKVTLCFRGRENVTKQERGSEVFEKVDKAFQDRGLHKNITTEGGDVKMGQLWSRVYYLKTVNK